MNNCGYSIESVWLDRTENPKFIGEKFIATLNSLSRGNQIFRNWGVSDVPESHDLAALEDAHNISLDQASENITDFVKGHIHYYEDTNQLDKDFGYDLLAFNNFEEDENTNPKDLIVAITAGAKFKNRANFMAGGYWMEPDPSVVTFPIFSLAIRTLIRIWAPTWANARAGGWNDAAGSIPSAYKALWGQHFLAPWMSYLSAPLAEGLHPPPDILAERLSDGGLLMIATEDRLDPTNPEHMRRAKLLADIMLQRVPQNVW
ncbi:Imm52 family immunity protein [Caulobacter sp. S45]|uniref:Imm52 family immunity protein n=1 Tax=Caulobacter sp. S45 TaxID=1641861 RepID=UPI00131BA20D|nr:Imm52 family immunity protein [Caulobacter sp. S45]